MPHVNNVIGIISYFPENKSKRANRRRCLRNLIEKCREIFNLPILLIAQNYTDDELSIFRNYGCEIHNYDKSGILRARYELQQLFINSDYDNLIMLDDDCVLKGSKKDGDLYLSRLNAHPNSYGLFSNNFLKLFSISKELYERFEWPLDKSVENGDLFEDVYLTMWLRKYYPDKAFRYKTNIRELSNSQSDKDSTWLEHSLDKTQMFNNTYNLIYESNC